MSKDVYFSTYDLYPDRWRELAEVQGIIKATTSDNEGGYDTAVNNIIQSLENVFFLSDDEGNGGADEYGCERWEKILGIRPVAGSSLEDRRYAIWLATLDPRPYTWYNLDDMLDELLGGPDKYIITRDVEKKVLEIRIFLGSMNQQKAIVEFIENIVPMDMILKIGQYYNRYFEIHKTYSQLGSYTYDQVEKDEIIRG